MEIWENRKIYENFQCTFVIKFKIQFLPRINDFFIIRVLQTKKKQTLTRFIVFIGKCWGN